MLRRLRVKNYKSLRNLDLRLNGLNVLVGPNAAGKSNILDCLAFVGELARGPGPPAFERRGGFADMVWGGVETERIEIGLQLELPSGRRKEALAYSLSVGPETKGAIQGEAAWFGDLDASGPTPVFYREGTLIHYPGRGRTVSVDSGRDSALAHVPPEEPEAGSFASALASIAIHDFEKARIATSQPVKRETRVAPDGSNAASVLHYLRNEETEAAERIENLLKDAIPEVTRLQTHLDPRKDGHVYIAFREKHVPGRIPAWNISEGSARLVATLLALLAPPAPSLVAIEAPETALHPYLCEYLVDILKLGARQTQVLITTHSPYLLDYLPSESLIIVEKDKGETRARRVRPSKDALKEAVRVLGLGKTWYAGHLGGVPSGSSSP